MNNVQAAKIGGQHQRRDTPSRRSRASTTAWVAAVVDGVRQASCRRLPGGWKRLAQRVDRAGRDAGHLAEQLGLYHSDGTPYTARHIRSGLLDAEAGGLLEIRRGRVEQRGDGTWHRTEISCYRVVSAKRRRRTDGKQAARTALSCAPPGQNPGHPDHQSAQARAVGEASGLAECVNPDCRAPYRGPGGLLCLPCRFF